MSWSRTSVYAALDTKHKIVIWVLDDLPKLKVLCHDYGNFHDALICIVKLDFSVVL